MHGRTECFGWQRTGSLFFCKVKADGSIENPLSLRHPKSGSAPRFDQVPHPKLMDCPFIRLSVYSIVRLFDCPHSGLIIGTQKAFYGMKGPDAQPTLSRTTHIDLTQIDQQPASRHQEEKLQNAMQNASAAFGALLTLNYTVKSRDEVTVLQDRLRAYMPNILERALRILAGDWYWCLKLIELGAPWTEQELETYIFNYQYEILRKTCASSGIWDQFVKDMKYAAKTPFPPHVVKMHLLTRIHGMKEECIAFHPKSLKEVLEESKTIKW